MPKDSGVALEDWQLTPEEEQTISDYFLGLAGREHPELLWTWHKLTSPSWRSKMDDLKIRDEQWAQNLAELQLTDEDWAAIGQRIHEGCLRILRRRRPDLAWSTDEPWIGRGLARVKPSYLGSGGDRIRDHASERG